MHSRLLLLSTFGLSMAALGQAPAAPDACTRLASVKLTAATVTAATVMADGAAPPELQLGAAQAKGLRSFCRVQILDQPSADSATHTEVWLPMAGWNGALSTRGNGGFAGQIYFDQMAAALGQNYATAGTDAGHSTPAPDFALDHPERVKDFGWRAIHDMTVQAKTLVAAFYGKPQTHAYFTACSDGGREALMEAQRFPTDYDGILAGAPAYNWTALLAGGASDGKAMLSTPASFIPADKLPAIGAAVRAACDAQDGVKDGVLNDPRSCHFDAATLACKDGVDGSSCLTPEQVRSLQAIYAPKKDASGVMIYPGYLPGAEDAPGSWNPWKTAAKRSDFILLEFFAEGFFRDFVHADPTWKLASFDLGADYRLAKEKTAADLDATDPNLKPFADHGGKLILYHGWNDPAISALGTISYYGAVRSALGPRATDASLRLYLVPGMLHCEGGPGATNFGQGGGAPRSDAGHDVFTALREWVETGKAPGTLTATGNGMTRPLCVYPAEARYTGGDTSKASSFSCTTTPQ